MRYNISFFLIYVPSPYLYSSTVLFITSHIITYQATSSTKALLYMGQEFKARGNYLMTATVCVPLCWLFSQALLRTFFAMDLGGQTCGLVYEFDNNKVDEHSLLKKVRSICNPTSGVSNSESASLGERFCLPLRKVKFVTEEGRWIVE